MNKIITALILVLFSVISYGQNSIITGKIVDSYSGLGISNIEVYVEQSEQTTTTDSEGVFNIEVSVSGEITITFTHESFITDTRTIILQPGIANNLGEIHLIEQSQSFTDIPTLDHLDIEDESTISAQNIIGLLSASQDLYISQSAFKFGATRFAIRGLAQEYTHTYINGVNFNDQIRGSFNFSMLGGLNDAVRNRDITMGTAASKFGFGDLGGLNNINTRASTYNKGGRATASATNKSYKLRGMILHSTGLMENNVAITASLGYRWADEGYVEGTFYNSMGYFLSVEKILGTDKNHSLSFTTLGAPTQRGMQGPSFQEAYELTNNNYYNPNWGYLNGEKRNARVATSYDPVAVFSHNWKINSRNEITTGVGFRYNQYGTTALNWYKAADPRPDYYRELPSYQTSDAMKQLYTEKWQTDKTKSQIDWHNLYWVNNYESNQRAAYMIEQRHNDVMELALNSVYSSKPTSNQTITIGLEAKKTKGMSYKTVSDLLGANYWLDVDQFAERDFQNDPLRIQNDLNNPNQQVKEGDVFGYDYDINVNNMALWFQNEFDFAKAQLYYAAKLSYTTFHRYGNMKNGRAPQNSYGKGKQHEFIDQALKAGGIYKITGRHMLSANAAYQTRAPKPFDSYLSARTKDFAVPNMESEKVASADFSYIVAHPTVSGRISAFQTNFFNQNELNSFYHDAYNTFVNYVMTEIEKEHRGFELGLSVNITQRLRASAIGTLAEYKYRNRPLGHITYENASKPDATETVYLKNFYVGGTPQTAASLSLNYSLPSYWFFEVSGNYFDRNYINLTPIRRTLAITDFETESLQEKVSRVQATSNQEKFEAGATLDASIGKSIRMARKYFLSINFSMNNILNNQTLVSSGFEQGRYDFTNNSIDRFPGKYYYSLGRTYFFNVGFRY